MRRRDIGKALLASASPLIAPQPAEAQSPATPHFARGRAEIAAGVIPVDFAYPGPDRGWLNVKRYGAVGDGVTDDTAAIQKAINVINDWSAFSSAIGANDGSTPDYNKGGTVFLPPGIYRVTAPILLAPNITLRGAHAIGQGHGSNFAGVTHDQTCTTIRAHFAGGRNWYVIDTGNWRQKDRRTRKSVEPYRALDAADQFFGVDKDDQMGTACPMCHIFDLRIDGNGTAFGGIRMQMWFYGRIDRVTVFDTKFVGITITGSYEASLGALGLYAPIGLNVQGTESLMQCGGGELTVYCAPTASWSRENQALIDRVFYEPQMGLANLVNPVAWYGLTLKGILCVWTASFTIEALAIDACNVGVEVYAGYLNILHWENEYTKGGALFLLRHGASCICDGLSSKATVPLASGADDARLLVRQPFFLANQTSFTPLRGERSSTFEVQLWDLALPDPVLGAAIGLSNINATRVHNPRINGLPFAGSVTLHVSTDGSPTLAGLLPTSPTTIDGALDFIENNPHILEWRIELKDAEIHSIAAAHSLKRVRIGFDRDHSAESEPTLSMRTPLLLDECSLLFNNVHVRGWTSSSAFEISNTLTINLGSRGRTGSPKFSIPAHSAIFAAADRDTCRIVAAGSFVDLMFAEGSGICSGGTDGYVIYEDSFANAAVAGTAALEAVTRGRVRKLASSIV